jgi:hypothetical protein
MSNVQIANYLKDNDDAAAIFGTGALMDKLRVYNKIYNR